MADADEDNARAAQPNTAEMDLSDETQDFRFLAQYSEDGEQPSLPRRGEKDFEPHGTDFQESILDASRAAMHTALSFPRIHTPKLHVVAQYYPESNMTRVENPRGPHFKSMGKADSQSKVWLLPEETLYLLERGNLDVRWPGTDMPMSLQGAYASFLGHTAEGELSLTLEKYTVYAGLRRAGYVVLRAPTWNADVRAPILQGGEKKENGSDFWLVSLFRRIYQSIFVQAEPLPLGPLIMPGLYRSYNDIYRRLQIFTPHNPRLPPQISAEAKSPFRVIYHVFKPSPSFKKSAPGEPDFRIAVINARTTPIPTMAQMSDLLESTPYDPPPEKTKNHFYNRLRHGYRNVILAVVDQGVTSYLRVSDAAFGQERIYEMVPKRGGYKKGGRSSGRGGRGGKSRGRGR